MVKIIELGHPTLRKIASKVDDVFSEETHRIIEKMKDAMKEKNGIGIAAPQIGESKQIFIVAPNQDLVAPYDHIDTGLIVINPSIEFNTVQETTEWEGCLSIPGMRGLVPRPCDITITYTNCHGEIRSERYQDFTARIFLHEYDHLVGTLFLDRIESINDHLITESVYLEMKEEE